MVLKMPHENHQLLDLLNDEAEFIRTKRGGLKKKYNTEKVYLYERHLKALRFEATI